MSVKYALWQQSLNVLFGSNLFIYCESPQNNLFKTQNNRIRV